MSSPAQITANRANAQLSTGPRSVEGKAVSSRNALKFGIHAKSLVIPGEDPEDLEALTREYDLHLAPAGPIQAALVETLVRAAWMLRRLSRIEAEVLRARMADLENPGEHPLGEAYLEDAAGARVLESIARRQQAFQRDYFKALKLLRDMQQPAHDNEVFASAFRHAADVPSLPVPPPENRLRFPEPPPHAARTAENLALRL